jgi:hypothetical protein
MQLDDGRAAARVQAFPQVIPGQYLVLALTPEGYGADRRPRPILPGGPWGRKQDCPVRKKAGLPCAVDTFVEGAVGWSLTCVKDLDGARAGPHTHPRPLTCINDATLQSL